MRARPILLVLAILLVAGFAAQNWQEITRPSTLNFGILQSQAPLGLILLSLLGLTLLLYLVGVASARTQSLVEYRQHTKELAHQRELADRAEASRFNDLRTMLDNHIRESRQQDGIARAEVDKLHRSQMDQISHLISARFGELESRLDAKLARLDTQNHGSARVVEATPVHHGVASRVEQPQHETFGRRL